MVGRARALRSMTRIAILAGIVGVACVACGSSRPPASDGFDDGRRDAGPGSNAFGSAPGASPPTCTEPTQFVYVVDAGAVLRRFDPPSATFTEVGTIKCPGATLMPFSMAVDRFGTAWVESIEGRLFQVSTADAACASTTFAVGQHGLVSFGMGFSTNAASGDAETLFVSGQVGTTETLGSIDTTSLVLTTVGAYDAIDARAELTGTGDGRLFAAFEGSPYVVAEIDKSDAHVVSQAPQAAIDYPPNGSNFAFAFWGGDFWLFVGPGTSTDVFQYRPTTGATTKVATETFVVVGAGVSTCAPTAPPN